MRALVAMIPVFLVAEALAGEQHFFSPDGKCEAYTTAAWQDGTAAKLFLRRLNSRDAGVLLKQNDRWIDAKWSPDSRFLAVIDHPDGRIADVYIFGIAAANPARPPIVTLLYHTPELRTYGVQWDLVDWLLPARSIILKKNVHFGFREETIVVHIGTTALKAPRPDQT
jgi:hypothetical protein